MKILIAPLNWGLGHAARCVPLIRQLQAKGHELVLAGDGTSLLMLQQHFPNLRSVQLPALSLRYSAKKRQVIALLMQMPKLVRFCMADHRYLARLLTNESFDCVISDNRFGLWNRHCKSVYITHQVMIKLPIPWHWLEPLAHWLHDCIIAHYDVCLIPDIAQNGGLSGDLAHRYSLPKNAKFIGWLSRFATLPKNAPITFLPNKQFSVVAVLSGLEPQRTQFEQTLIKRYKNTATSVLIVRGLPQNDFEVTTEENIVLVPYLTDAEMAAKVRTADKIISRSGYSSLMDWAALDVLDKVELVPTPGQTEQEYLAQWVATNGKKNYLCNRVFMDINLF